MNSGHTAIRITGEMTIGEIVAAIPNSVALFEKYFHGGCNHCPSKATEPLWLAARLYGHNLEKIISELEQLATESVKPASGIPVLSARERRLAREKARGI